MKNKKGQGILTVLFTYSWAVMLVIIGIGAFAYFGVFDPFFAPKITYECCVDYCNGLGGFICSGFKSNILNV